MASFGRHDVHPLFDRCVSVLHLASPLLIPASMVVFEPIELVIAR